MEAEPIYGAKHIRGTDETCPADGTRLDLYSFFGMEFESCPTCGGLWLHRDELRKLKNKLGVGQLHWLNAEVDALETSATGASKRMCPEDQAQLATVRFGKSSVVLDWCPKCHGLWLDRDEFQKVIGYLRDELDNASVKDVEKEIAEDFKKLVHGGPESRVAEIGDIAAAVTALLNFNIFEHPVLFKFLSDSQASARSIGMD